MLKDKYVIIPNRLIYTFTSVFYFHNFTCILLSLLQSKLVSFITQCTQREQNARPHMTSLTSSVNYHIIDHLLFVFEAMLEDIKMK